MPYWLLFIMAGVGLALLILPTHLLIGRYTRKRFWKSFGIAHGLFISMITVIYIFSKKDAQHQLFWLIPAAVDLPVSLLFFFLPLECITAVFFAFLTLGTLQYAIIGSLLDSILTRFRKPPMVNKKY